MCFPLFFPCVFVKRLFCLAHLPDAMFFGCCLLFSFYRPPPPLPAVINLSQTARVLFGKLLFFIFARSSNFQALKCARQKKAFSFYIWQRNKNIRDLDRCFDWQKKSNWFAKKLQEFWHDLAPRENDALSLWPGLQTLLMLLESSSSPRALHLVSFPKKKPGSLFPCIFSQWYFCPLLLFLRGNRKRRRRKPKKYVSRDNEEEEEEETARTTLARRVRRREERGRWMP